MPRRIVVAGAGIAGLSAAYELTSKDPALEVTLLESSARVGGKILSEKAGGVIFEGGPDSFVTNKPWGLELVRELGLDPELLRTNDKDKDVFVYARGRLRRFPEGLMLMAPTRIIPFLRSDLVPWPAKLRMGLELLVPRGDPDKDESLGEFARRRFGDEALETIVGPVLAGIHAGDPDKLSLRSTFPQFRDMELKHRSIYAAMRALARERARAERGKDAPTLFMTLRGGLSRLPETLAGRLPAGAIKLNSGIRTLERRPGGGYSLSTESGGTFDADAVILALPASAAAKLIPDEPLSRELASIEFCSSATASLLFDAVGPCRKLNGFGFVVDRRERRGIMAATYSSTKFPGRAPDGTTLIRCFLGGAGRDAAVSGTDEDILSSVRGELKALLGIEADPLEARVYRWPSANPQYNVGHGARLERIAARLRSLPGVILAGSSYRGVGIPECVRSGREAAGLILAAGDAPPMGTVV